jgi:hypothetical protein
MAPAPSVDGGQPDCSGHPNGQKLPEVVRTIGVSDIRQNRARRAG